MRMSLWEKIEAIQREPEHIRQRYVAVCVSVAMVFIVGVWLLSIEDSVSTATSDVPDVVENGKGLTDKTPSLNELFGEGTPLRVEGDEADTGDFFEKQMESQKSAGQDESMISPER